MKQQEFPEAAREGLKSFATFFKDDSDVYSGPLGSAWAPGRVNIIGEHTDYNDGFVLPCAVDRVSSFSGRARKDAVVRLWSTHFDEYAQFDLEDLPQSFDEQRDHVPKWARYVLGVASLLKKEGAPLTGFDAVLAGDVPLGGGMSSSAALEVATAYALAFFSGGGFSIGEENATFKPMEIAALCQHAEHIASGVRCGILDQAASCLGRPDHAVLLDCRSMEYRYIPFDTTDVSLVVIDTNVRHDLSTTDYNERREQCEEATKLLGEVLSKEEGVDASMIVALRDITLGQFNRYKDRLPEILRKRAGYVISEDERVMQAVKCLEQSRFEQLGQLMWRTHDGLRDDYEVSIKELDVLVEIARTVPGVLGGRMMGGGFGGCTVNLVNNDAREDLRRAVEAQYSSRIGKQPSVELGLAAAGPGFATLDLSSGV